MPKKATSKRFASKAEEAAWWEANDKAVANAFEKAMDEGYVGPCTVVVTGDSTATRIHLVPGMLPEPDHKRRNIAGLGFHAYLKAVIHYALHKFEDESGTAAS